MFNQAAKIINKKAFTQSGQFLGRVADLEVDSTGQKIIRYYIQGGFLAKLKESLIIISASQIVAVKEDRIIVEDASVKIRDFEVKKEAKMEYSGG